MAKLKRPGATDSHIVRIVCAQEATEVEFYDDMQSAQDAAFADDCSGSSQFVAAIQAQTENLAKPARGETIVTIPVRVSAHHRVLMDRQLNVRGRNEIRMKLNELIGYFFSALEEL